GLSCNADVPNRGCPAADTTGPTIAGKGSNCEESSTSEIQRELLDRVFVRRQKHLVQSEPSPGTDRCVKAISGFPRQQAFCGLWQKARMHGLASPVATWRARGSPRISRPRNSCPGAGNRRRLVGPCFQLLCCGSVPDISLTDRDGRARRGIRLCCRSRPRASTAAD